VTTHLKEIIFVFVGGGIGTGLRFGVQAIGGEGLVPLLVVNVVGSFALGWYFTRHPVAHGQISAFFAVGLLGSLTTFSAFAVETVLLADAGAWFGAAGWVLGSIVAGLAAAIVGRITAGGT
jgi:CrcB protein